MTHVSLQQALMALCGSAWSACSITVLALVGWDLVRCRRAPSLADGLLVVGGPISLLLAARLALKDSR